MYMYNCFRDGADPV